MTTNQAAVFDELGVRTCWLIDQGCVFVHIWPVAGLLDDFALCCGKTCAAVTPCCFLEPFARPLCKLNSSSNEWGMRVFNKNTHTKQKDK